MPIRTKGRTKIPAPAVSVSAGPLNVPMIKQEQTQWCWAGCTDMVAHYYGNAGVAQCDFANFLFGQLLCCSSPSSSQCNNPCQVNDVSRVYTNYGINSALSQSSVSFATLDFEVSNSRPVEVAYFWTNGGGHVALVIETVVINNQQVVRVNDPIIGSGGVLYTDLLTAYGQGTWVATWTNIRK